MLNKMIKDKSGLGLYGIIQGCKKSRKFRKIMDKLVDSGRKEMTPWLVAAVGAGAAMTVAVQKFQNIYVLENKYLN